MLGFQARAPENDVTEPATPTVDPRTIVRQMIPGAVLPGLIYFVASRRLTPLVALALASSVPSLHALGRLVRGKRPSTVGMLFVVATGISITLAAWFRSPTMILTKGVVLTALSGMALALSASLDRPLTRTIALHLCAEDTERRRELAGRWDRPQTMMVFRTLSFGWGFWLLLAAFKQLMLVATVSPGTYVAVEHPIMMTATAVGIAISVSYVRRRQVQDPELGLLPARATR